jgi:putative tryptophan/tyrosine transport system substrate-binding protein
MNRREFIVLIGGAGVAWPRSAHAQATGEAKRIGVLLNATETDPLQQAYVAAFEQVLRTSGWKIGQNLAIDYRWSHSLPERTNAFAAEIVALMPDLIFANTTASLTAVVKLTKTIPIVFAAVSDPVAQGFVSNLARPGGNMTGFSAYEFSIGSKWLGLLGQLVPNLARVALMFNPTTSPQSSFFLKSVQAAAQTIGMDATPLPIHDQADIEPAIAGYTREPNGGLIIATDNFLAHNAKTVTDLAARYRLPAVYAQPEFIKAGGLMAYAVDVVDDFRGAALYVDRILKGTKPGDLPIQLTTKFKLTVNLKTLQALGLEMPMSMMLSVDDVIE